jgi:asparagine synthase (glutamine-hydrolysing)
MCGIAGFCGFEDRKLLREMCDAIRHRGPDGEGYHVDKGICLGNRRLSIIDIEGGSQPMYNEDGSVVVVYNGEIYNFREIRKELEKRGHRFSTNSDTEVLVHGYEEYGHDILQRLNGMFAFALWDSKRRELFVARDRLGIKPLYYYWDGEVMVFCSEIKGLLKLPRIERKLDQTALNRYLVFRYIPGDLTIIEGIKKLKPGHFLTLKNNKIGVQKYWDVSFGKEIREIGKCKKGISELLEDSVKKRLISDVPLGAFLSGGIDSSIIVGLMSKFSDRVKTFSVGFDEEGYSELGPARAASEHLGTEHHEIMIDSEKFIKILPKVVWHMDEPLADPAAIPTYYVSELASRKVKVVLTGEGGDELFCGYPKYGMHGREALTRYYLKSPGFARKALKRASPEKYRLRLDSLEAAGRFYIAPYIKNAKLLERNSHIKTGIKADIASIFNPYMGMRDTMREMQLVDIKTWLPEELLMKVDKMTMANSLEARVPFLDHILVDFSMRIPSGLKIRSGVEKYILRESFPKLLTKRNLERKKHPFSVPIGDWDKEISSTYLESALNLDLVKKHINKSYVKTKIQQYNVITLYLWHTKVFYK